MAALLTDYLLPGARRPASQRPSLAAVSYRRWARYRAQAVLGVACQSPRCLAALRHRHLATVLLRPITLLIAQPAHRPRHPIRHQYTLPLECPRTPITHLSDDPRHQSMPTGYSIIETLGEARLHPHNASTLRPKFSAMEHRKRTRREGRLYQQRNKETRLGWLGAPTFHDLAASPSHSRACHNRDR